jgi:hypothetical protein
MRAKRGETLRRARVGRQRIEMQAITVDQPVQTVGLKEVERRIDADRIGLDAAEPLAGVVEIGQPSGDDRRAPVERGVVADVLQRGEGLQVAKIALGDLSPSGSLARSFSVSTRP